MLTDVTPEMDAYREEFFGPVGVVYQVADEDEAVTIANDTTFGLGSYVFTTDEEQAERVADKIEAGMVYVNVVLADSPELPFGGVKRCGTVARDGPAGRRRVRQQEAHPRRRLTRHPISGRSRRVRRGPRRVPRRPLNSPRQAPNHYAQCPKWVISGHW